MLPPLRRKIKPTEVNKMTTGPPLRALREINVGIATRSILDDAVDLRNAVTSNLPLKAGDYLINLRMVEWGNQSYTPPPLDKNLIIAPCTDDCKPGTIWKGTGLIVARYSMYYGAKPGRVRMSAADAGYALDIPKTPSAVRRLLMDDRFLTAILDRDADKIRGAVTDVSASLWEPILVTPYLDVALEKRLK
jgi:hypothetical protein